jgi:hypothetical protein
MILFSKHKQTPYLGNKFKILPRIIVNYANNYAIKTIY